MIGAGPILEESSWAISVFSEDAPLAHEDAPGSMQGAKNVA
jgi:hypothetical protein